MHPVDELKQVRDQLKSLEEKEQLLKKTVLASMGNGSTLAGEKFIAVKKLVDRKGGLDEDRIPEQFRFRKSDSQYATLTFAETN